MWFLRQWGGQSKRPTKHCGRATGLGRGAVSTSCGFGSSCTLALSRDPSVQADFGLSGKGLRGKLLVKGGSKWLLRSPHCRTGCIICRAQCKMKMGAPRWKVIKKFQSRALIQAQVQVQGPVWLQLSLTHKADPCPRVSLSSRLVAKSVSGDSPLS